jgi:plasmid stability protein
MVRGLADETHRALRLRALENRRSMQAEMRAILDAAARPEGREVLGTMLAQMSRDFGGAELVMAKTHSNRDAVREMEDLGDGDDFT